MNQQPSNAELMTAIMDLQGAVSAGFAGVDRRFHGVEERLGGLEDRVGSLEGRLTAVEGRLAGLERWTVHADMRFDRIDSRLEVLELRRRR